MKVTILVSLLAGLVIACNIPDRCSERSCADLAKGTSFPSNGRHYSHCLVCFTDGTCETSLQDETGRELFDCTDAPGRTCTEAVVNAEFAYCGIG